MPIDWSRHDLAALHLLDLCEHERFEVEHTQVVHVALPKVRRSPPMQVHTVASVLVQASSVGDSGLWKLL